MHDGACACSACAPAEDLCEGVVCKPVGPCDKASACDTATGACQVTEHVPAGAACNTGLGRCTANHTCGE